jgi:hypothetical protein
MSRGSNGEVGASTMIERDAEAFPAQRGGETEISSALLLQLIRPSIASARYTGSRRRR